MSVCVTAPTTPWPEVPLANSTSQGRSPVDDNPEFFTAIQEQLGLKLEDSKAPLPILVIDSIEPPTPD